MGLYDCVRCEHPLPDPLPAGVRRVGQLFQTKAFECYLNTLVLTADGRLVCEPKGPGGWGYGLSPGDLSDYHGDVWLTAVGVPGAVEYVARFTDGRLARLTLVEPTEGV